MASDLKEFLDKQYKILSETISSGGNRRVQCLHCNREFTGSLTRQKFHLLGVRGKQVSLCDNFPGEGLQALWPNIFKAIVLVTVHASIFVGYVILMCQ